MRARQTVSYLHTRRTYGCPRQNHGYKGPTKPWIARTCKTMDIKDQQNHGYQELAKPWISRIGKTMDIKDSHACTEKSV